MAAVLLCLAVELAPAGGAKASPEAADPAGEVLARGDGFTITLDEFRARMAEQNEQVRARLATPEKRREFLENLIRFEVLAAEARRQGLERDPEVALTLEKVMVQRLVKLRFGGPGDKLEKTRAFDEWLASLRARSHVEVSADPLDALPAEPVPSAQPAPPAAPVPPAAAPGAAGEAAAPAEGK